MCPFQFERHNGQCLSYAWDVVKGEGRRAGSGVLQGRDEATVWDVAALPTTHQMNTFPLAQVCYIHTRALEKYCLGSCSKKLPREVSGPRRKEGRGLSPDAQNLEKEL